MKVVFDIKKTGLALEDFPDQYSKYIDLYFSFLDDGKSFVRFSNLSFGYSISLDGVVIQSQSYPPINVEYVTSDQEFIETDRIYDLDPDLDYTLDVWVNHNSKQFQESYEINMPRPLQPFDSWSWDSDFNEWMPPFLPPDDGKFYDWDENTQSWFVIELDN